MSHFNVLPDELLQRIFDFVPNEHRYIAAIDRRFRNVYPSKSTTAESAVQSVARLQIWMTEYDDDDDLERKSIVRAAFGVGNLEVLQFKEGRLLRGAFEIDTWCEAAWHGRMHVLEWGRTIGAMRFSVGLCRAAAEGDQLATLQWLRAHNCPWAHTAYAAAAKQGHVHILEWLWDNSCPWESVYLWCARSVKHLHVLKWLHARGCRLGRATFGTAAADGSMDTIRWLMANNCPRNEWVCSRAVEKGRLDVLMFLRENSCPWDERVCACATKYGHLNVLMWAIKNGCPFDKPACILLAIESSHKEVVDWLS